MPSTLGIRWHITYNTNYWGCETFSYTQCQPFCEVALLVLLSIVSTVANEILLLKAGITTAHRQNDGCEVHDNLAPSFYHIIHNLQRFITMLSALSWLRSSYHIFDFSTRSKGKMVFGKTARYFDGCTVNAFIRISHNSISKWFCTVLSSYNHCEVR